MSVYRSEPRCSWLDLDRPNHSMYHKTNVQAQWDKCPSVCLSLCLSVCAWWWLDQLLVSIWSQRWPLTTWSGECTSAVALMASSHGQHIASAIRLHYSKINCCSRPTVVSLLRVRESITAPQFLPVTATESTVRCLDQHRRKKSSLLSVSLSLSLSFYLSIYRRICQFVTEGPR